MLQLRRITSSVAYIPEIDGIRFIAILLVVFYHLNGDILRHSPPGYVNDLYSSPLFWVAVRGIFGVHMFFVVSGFVLALPFARSRFAGGRAPDLKRYYLRRVTRLEPPYIAALVLFFFLKVLAGRGTAAVLWPHLLASIIYQHNLIYGVPSSIEFVAWTLEIEVQFYILAPLIAAIVFRSSNSALRRTGMLAAMLVAGGMARTLYPLSPRFGISILCYLQYFLAGFLLADLYVLMKPGTRSGAGWDLVAIAGIIGPFVWMYLELPLELLAPPTLMLGYYAVFRGIFVRRILSDAVISTVGGMCYSIYLIHNYVIASGGFLTERISALLSFPLRFGLQALFLMPLVLAASIVFYVLIERPCMNPEWPSQLARWLGFSGSAQDEAGRLESVR